MSERNETKALYVNSSGNNQDGQLVSENWVARKQIPIPDSCQYVSHYTEETTRAGDIRSSGDRVIRGEHDRIIAVEVFASVHQSGFFDSHNWIGLRLHVTMSCSP